ncbi:MAG: SDR family oxidoreductase [Hahellaceae bacterium]|nr:SDR family oxidoreductase [Hahellaceae bacterium]
MSSLLPLQLSGAGWSQKLLSYFSLVPAQAPRRTHYRLAGGLKTPVLVAGTRNGAVLQHILHALTTLGAPICLPESSHSLFKGKASSESVTQVKWVRLDKIRSTPREQVQAIVFDSSELGRPEDLIALYQLFHPIIEKLAPGAKILVMGKPPLECRSPEAAATQEGLQGFVRSLAKEIGPRHAATANLIYLHRPSACDLTSTLAFFLTGSSAYVSGQTLTLQGQQGAIRVANSPLAGKTALITGASQGLGIAIAESLHAQGAKIIGIDPESNRARLKSVMRSVRGRSLSLDLTVPSSAGQLKEYLDKEETLLDIVVHTGALTTDTPLGKLTPTQWSQVVDTHLGRVTRLTGELLEADLIASQGRIIALGTLPGLAGQFGQTHHAAATAGLSGYIRHLSHHLPAGITANVVVPGFIESEWTQTLPFTSRELARRLNSLGQGGLPVDIGNAVAYLSHPASEGVTGQTLRVCGQNLLGR